MKKIDEFFEFATLCLILLAMGYGWIWNIVKLCTYNESLGKMLARAISIFVWPVGAIIGYL